MLIFFVLCAFLHSLQGASVPPPPDALGSVAPTNMSAPMGCECPAAPDDEGHQLRTVGSIVQSCLFTIFACIWTSAHPNINGPMDSGWACLKRRAIIMLYTVIAPEFVLFWAFLQYLSAKDIAKEYNKKFARSGEAEGSLWAKAVGWFRPLPKAITRRGDGQSWTIVHGFFIQMGGFILYDNEHPKEVLDYEHLAKLLEDQTIDAPTVTERELQDRSKGDTISKGIIMLQTLWFVTQCIVRGVQRLPLSELEVLTLAFAVMNVAIYATWWNKPQGVDMAIGIPLKRIKEEVDRSRTPPTIEASCEPENPSHPELAGLPQSHHWDSNDNLTLIPPPAPAQEVDEPVEEMHAWFWRKVQKDYQNYGLPSFLFVRIPFRILLSVLRPIHKLGAPGEVERKTRLRLPMFHSEGRDVGSPHSSACFLSIGPIFGATHLISWASVFPSPHDLVLWRISAIVVTTHPLLLSLIIFPATLGMRVITTGLAALIALMIPFYIAARFALIIIALKAIVHPPPGILLDVSWTSYIPHF